MIFLVLLVEKTFYAVSGSRLWRMDLVKEVLVCGVAEVANSGFGYYFFKDWWA